MSDAPSDELTCVQVVSLITEYLEGALPPDDVVLLEEHLAECSGCTVVLQQFRTTVRVTRRLTEDDVDALDPGARADLLATFRRWSAERAD